MSQIIGYEKGMLQKVVPKVTEGCWEGHCYMHDDEPVWHPDDEMRAGDVLLPHSCQEWIIGGKENIEALIADLQDALAK